MNKLPDIDLWLPNYNELPYKTIEVIHNKQKEHFRLLRTGNNNIELIYRLTNINYAYEWVKRSQYINITNSNLKLFILCNFFINKGDK